MNNKLDQNFRIYTCKLKLILVDFTACFSQFPTIKTRKAHLSSSEGTAAIRARIVRDCIAGPRGATRGPPGAHRGAARSSVRAASRAPRARVGVRSRRYPIRYNSTSICATSSVQYY